MILGVNFLSPTTFKPPFKINALFRDTPTNPGTAKPEKSTTTKRENPVHYYSSQSTTDDDNDVSHVSDSKVPAANQNRVKTGSFLKLKRNSLSLKYQN